MSIPQKARNLRKVTTRHNPFEFTVLVEKMKEERMTEEEIRKKIAQEILKAHDSAAKRLQPGLWYAATLIDPNVMEGDD